MCGSDPRISEWSIADAHVPVRTYTFLVRSDRLDTGALTGRLISVSCLAQTSQEYNSPEEMSAMAGRFSGDPGR